MLLHFTIRLAQKIKDRQDEFVFHLIYKTFPVSVLSWSLSQTATARFLYLKDTFPARLIM